MRGVWGVVVAVVLAVGSAEAEGLCENLSNADRGYCLSDYGAFVEQQMVSAYIEAERQLAIAVQAKVAPRIGDVAILLQPSQVAFESFRAAQCDIAAALALGGSGTANIYQSCRIELTIERIGFLRQIASIGDL